MKAKEKYIYADSFEFYIKRIEVFSFSGCMCPFYTIQGVDGCDRVLGGAFGKRLSDVDDVLFESRVFSGAFVNVIAFAIETGESLYPYETAKMVHRVVADSGMMEPQRVLVDVYSNGKDNKYALGGSRFIVNRDFDGKITLVLDDVEIDKL